MPNSNLLPHRQNHVFNIYNETEKYATSSTFDRENRKAYFFDLILKNKELNECEKNYCQEMFIRNFELHNVIHKFGEPMTCRNCKSTRYSARYCEVCIKQHLQNSFGSWTSGDVIVDDFIQKCQLISLIPPYIIEWIPFEQFKDITYLTNGGFSTVYTATWTRGSIYDWDENKKMFIYFEYFGPQKVVLKSLNDSNDPGKKFFDEAINYFKIQSNSIVYCHGITRFPENGNYMIVMNSHPEENLRNYLKINHSTLNLKNRISIFRCLCMSLYDIHKKNLVHCDLHSGNILMESNNCFITDLGFCGPADEKSSNEVYGIIPYIAPEVFERRKHTKESDIYSVGMLLWEIFSGCPPFDDKPHDTQLIIEICNGLRPLPPQNIPMCFAEIMQKCWNIDPLRRPTIEELCEFANYEFVNIYKDGKYDNTISVLPISNLEKLNKSHSLAYSSSRILSKVIPESIRNSNYVTSQYNLTLPNEICEDVSQ